MTYKRAALGWLLQCAQRREFRFIYKPEILPGKDDMRILFHIFLTTTRNHNEIQRSILLIMIICEMLLLTLLVN